MKTKLLHTYLKARTYWQDLAGELDEKALLIVFFVLIAIGGLTTMGDAVSGTFKSIASKL